MPRFQRNSDGGEEQRATTLELFYDLVFVFAITQVSHLLLDHLSWEGLAQATLALLVVWWAWNYTTWVTNELDPDSAAVRVLLLAIMLASLVMAVAIPGSFADRALLFAGSYVALQVGRHLFLTFAAAERGTLERERAGRILMWFAAAGVFWIAGALVEDARWPLWLVALAIDYAAPLVLFWVPGLRRLDHTTWHVETAHFAERFQLFVIIALGETIILTGVATSALDLTGGRLTALVLAFVSTAALWWLYFNYVATIAERRLELAGDGRTRLARDGYTYLHVVLVAGVILTAVGDKLVVAHPWDELPAAELAIVAAGPALYLLAHVLFRLRMAGSLSRKRLAGAVGCLLTAAVGLVTPALVVAALVVAVLVTVIAAERASEARRRARGEPSPLERLEAAEA